MIFLTQVSVSGVDVLLPTQVEVHFSNLLTIYMARRLAQGGRAAEGIIWLAFKCNDVCLSNYSPCSSFIFTVFREDASEA